jgi:hypothetical protein
VGPAPVRQRRQGIVFADYVAEAARRGKKVGVGEWGL